jgi:type III restriction enzyme
MIDGIKYEKIGNSEYEMRLFEDYEIHVNDMTFYISQKEKTIYSNMVPLDSGVEYQFAKDCETREDVEYYFKLPFWFKIKTPIGNYAPDWALIKKNEKTVYFVAETKSENQELKDSEKRKIKCGKAHFHEFEGVEYMQVSKVSDLD